MRTQTEKPFPADGASALPETPAIAIDAVSFSYDGCEQALDNISLTVRQNEFLAVIGPNGGGKTTLLRLMLGLLAPLSGSITIFGGQPAAMRSHIGYVPQFSTMQPDFPASVLDSALMGGACPTMRAGGWATGKEARDRAMGYLETLGLADCAARPLHALSGGQRQRVLVARALMGRPANREHSGSFLLLLDEPTASIDPEGKFCFYEFLGKLRGSVSVIVVSHDLFMVSPFFNNIAFVNKTVIRLGGNELSPENIFALFGQHPHGFPVADMRHKDGPRGNRK